MSGGFSEQGAGGAPGGVVVGWGSGEGRWVIDGIPVNCIHPPPRVSLFMQLRAVTLSETMADLCSSDSRSETVGRLSDRTTRRTQSALKIVFKACNSTQPHF